MNGRGLRVRSNRAAAPAYLGGKTLTTDNTSFRRTALPALALAALTLAGLLSGCGSSVTAQAQAPDVTPEASVASTVPVTASASPSSTGSATPSASTSAKVIPPDPAKSEDWRTKAKQIKQMGASGRIVYTDNSDGAVLAFEDFFGTMAWEFAEFYEAEEDDVSTDAEKDDAIDRQLFRTVKYLDREAMGRDKVNDIFSDYALELAVLGASKVDIVASRHGIEKASDGTVTISDANLFYMDDGEMAQFGDGDGPFKLKYESDIQTWVIIDRISNS